METFARPFRWLLGRFAAILASARIPASLLTLIGFACCVLAGVFFGAGRFAAAGLVLIPAALCDLTARPLAQLQTGVDFFGAFLKSVLHRYADLALFVGLLVYYATVNRFLYALLTGVALAGAVMVSYSQARAESLIARCRVGFWERPERLGLVIIGAVLNRLPIVLVILAVGTNFTVIHRIYQTWKETEGRQRAAQQAVAARLSLADKGALSPRIEARPESRPGEHADSRLRDLLARAAKRGA